MGLLSLMKFGFMHLRIRTMMVLFNSGRKKPFSSQMVAAEKISGPYRYHNFLKNATFKSSGSGDLSDYIWKRDRKRG